jgi:hypothetical protein
MFMLLQVQEIEQASTPAAEAWRSARNVHMLLCHDPFGELR